MMLQVIPSEVEGSAVSGNNRRLSEVEYGKILYNNCILDAAVSDCRTAAGGGVYCGDNFGEGDGGREAADVEEQGY